MASTKKLEEEVNAFIAQLNIKVLELQYSTGSNTYSVMVVYEKKLYKTKPV